MTAADDLRALSAAATPGPWEDAGVEILGPGHVQHRRGVAYTWGPREYEDADLIVWCRNHADALANLIDAARGLLDEQREGVGQQACEYVTPCPKYHLDDTDRWCGWCRLIPALAALEADR